MDIKTKSRSTFSQIALLKSSRLLKRSNLLRTSNLAFKPLRNKCCFNLKRNPFSISLLQSKDKYVFTPLSRVETVLKSKYLPKYFHRNSFTIRIFLGFGSHSPINKQFIMKGSALTIFSIQISL